jgi:hypothetical protein
MIFNPRKEAPLSTFKKPSDLEENGFHLKPISRRSCSQCNVANICDILMQTDGIIVLPGRSTCDTVRARGPKHN